MLFGLVFPLTAFGDAVDLSTPQGALHAFVLSQAVFDSTKLKACTYNIGPANLDAFCESALALRAFDKLAAEKFSASPKPKPVAPKSIEELAAQAERDWATLTTIRIRVQGDDAVLPGPRGKGFKFHKIDGQWKVNADAMYSDPMPELEQRNLIVMRISTPIWKQLTQELAGGKFADWPAVEKAGKQRMAAALSASSEYQAAEKALAEARRKRTEAIQQSTPPAASPKGPQGHPAGGYDASANAKRTAMVGGDGGGEFTNRNPGDGPVIGFRYEFGNWNNRQVLSTLEPLFESPVVGKPEVRKRNKGTVLARDGYAVGALLVDTDNVNAVAVRVTFMRVKEGRLDAKQAYTGEWIGTPSHIRQEKLGGSGETIVGTFGRKGLNLDALGLLLESDIRKTAIVGGPGGGPFASDVTGAPVTGFGYKLGNWGGRSVLSNLEPVFSDSDPSRPQDDNAKVVRAREGYVVAGLLADTDETNVTAVRITFVRLKNAVLDPSDTYQSDWIGTPSGIHQKQLGGENGQIVLGTCGRKGLNLDALGLLVGTPTSAVP